MKTQTRKACASGSRAQADGDCHYHQEIERDAESTLLQIEIQVIPGPSTQKGGNAAIPGADNNDLAAKTEPLVEQKK